MAEPTHEMVERLRGLLAERDRTRALADAATGQYAWADRNRASIAYAALAEALIKALPALLDAAIPTNAPAGWQPIETAPRDGTIVWAVIYADLFPRVRPEREDLARWNGLQVPVRHPGICEDGFDIGWGVAAPVGHGGFPDDWFAGWMPLPAAPGETPSPAIPADYVLVPREPTEAMIAAWGRTHLGLAFTADEMDLMSDDEAEAEAARLDWSAMIAAAPAPRAEEG